MWVKSRGVGKSVIVYGGCAMSGVLCLLVMCGVGRSVLFVCVGVGKSGLLSVVVCG